VRPVASRAGTTVPEITECRNIADKNVLDLEHSKTHLQNMQTQLKKEITEVSDAYTDALGTTIRTEVCMPVLVCARFCVDQPYESMTLLCRPTL
jgi:hypothetical protein